MDVALLFLNAGTGDGTGPLHLKDDDDVELTMRVNAEHVIYLAKVLLEKMMKRPNNRSGIVITSSIMSMMPIPGS